MVRIRPIRDEQSYQAALTDIERFFDNEPTPGTAEADEFAVMLDLIAAYEARRWPIETGDPVTFLREAMAMTGRTQLDLAELIGSKSRASEILNRKRHLSLNQIQTISRTWGLPAEALITPYELTG